MQKSNRLQSAQLLAKVITACWQDDEFKNRLMQDPRGTLEQFFGQPLAHEASISVLEETTDHYYIIIPRNPKTYLRRDLSEDALNRIATTDCDATEDDETTNFVNCYCPTE